MSTRFDTPAAQRQALHAPARRQADSRETVSTGPVDRDRLRRAVAADVRRFLAAGHAIVEVPMGASGIDVGGRRTRRSIKDAERLD